MKGIIVNDWSKVNMKDPTDRAKVFGAVQHFLRAPAENVQLKEAFKHFATTGDFPTSVLQVLEKFRLTTPFDTGYEQIFDVRDFTQSDRNGFDILDVEDSLVIEEVPVGQKAKIYKMFGSKVTVNFALYAGGLGWHRTLFDDKEYWTIEDNAVAFQNKTYAQKAQAHYALIEEVGAGQNLAWQLPDPAALPNTDALYTANRDAQTMNAAAQQIVLDCEGKGYGISPENTPFIVLCPLQLRGRIRKALNVMQQAVTGSKTQIDYQFQQITTTMLATTSVYYVILPKQKLKSGNRMNPTVFDAFDPKSYSDISVVWMRYGAAIGDQEQVVRCATA